MCTVHVLVCLHRDEMHLQLSLLHEKLDLLGEGQASKDIRDPLCAGDDDSVHFKAKWCQSK